MPHDVFLLRHEMEQPSAIPDKAAESRNIYKEERI
jgi:hypothetical protein